MKQRKFRVSICNKYLKLLHQCRSAWFFKPFLNLFRGHLSTDLPILYLLWGSHETHPSSEAYIIFMILLLFVSCKWFNSMNLSPETFWKSSILSFFCFFFFLRYLSWNASVTLLWGRPHLEILEIPFLFKIIW